MAITITSLAFAICLFGGFWLMRQGQAMNKEWENKDVSFKVEFLNERKVAQERAKVLKALGFVLMVGGLMVFAAIIKSLL